MSELTKGQRHFLRGLGQRLNPVVNFGKNGLTESMIRQIQEALRAHELIKIRFQEFKEEKEEYAEAIAKAAGCERVGIVGHVALFYKAPDDLNKRKIRFPNPAAQ